MPATEHHNLQLIGAATVQNMWAIIDGNMVLVERGRTVKVTAGEALTVRQLVWLDDADAKVHPATNADRPMLGFATEDADADTETYIQTDGVVIDDQPTPTWDWTPGALLYADDSPTPAPGELSETPAGPPVAVALDAVTIWILAGGMQVVGAFATEAYVDARAATRGRALYLAVPGAVAAGTTVSMIVPSPIAGTITAVKSTARVAASTDYTLDIHKGGTTIYTTQGNRPVRTSAHGTGLATHTLPDVTAISANDLFTVDVDVEGTDLEDLLMVIYFTEA
jgi:hypothetical protein